MHEKYGKQDRGSASAYAEYFRGMDRSMAQKVALVSAYLPAKGTVADMGSGSGKGSYDLARLFPDLAIVGVDVSPVAVEHAREMYALPNLEFRVGDIAHDIFPEGSLDAIVNSSVLHHVTSFNDFQLQKIYRLFDAQTRALKEGGVLTVRDFVAPSIAKDVLLELPSDDGKDRGEPAELSTAALFEEFCRTFHCAAYRNGNIPFTRVTEDDRHAVYRVSLRYATEFLLRKDYRESWATELNEEYLYFTQEQFEEEFRRRNMRILLSKPVTNDWIVEHRWRGRAVLREIDGTPTDFPATNYLIVGEKVSGGSGVVIREMESAALERPAFLRMEHFRHRTTGKVWDLVSRPHETIDVVPWFSEDGKIYVVGRSRYPRPIVNTTWKDAPFERTGTSGYVNEPITAVIPEGKEPEAFVREILRERAGILPEAIQSVGVDALRYYPSPGGTNEVVHSYAVAITPQHEFLGPRTSDGHSPEKISAFNAQQLLRSCQIGGMLDARLELNTYHLLLTLGIPIDPWIGGVFPVASFSGETLRHASVGEVLGEPLAPFVEADGPGSSRYLSVRRGHFEEYTADDVVRSSWDLEYVVPQMKSTNTIIVAGVLDRGGAPFLALEERELPMAQRQSGSATYLDIPAWRLPKDVTTRHAADEFLRARFSEEFGMRIASVKFVGGSFYPSPGTSPETAMLAAVAPETHGNGKLAWVALARLVSERLTLRDGHLLVTIFRVAHCLGLMSKDLTKRETSP